MNGPEARFAANARRLAGLAGRLLGWEPPSFWAATPAELGAILFDDDSPPDAPLGRGELEALMERDENG